MKNNIDIVLDSVPLSSLIGKFIRIKPSGRGAFTACCPFHNEKTPSFRIDDEKRLYYCFGCNKGGNIFTFLQDYKHISFADALGEIAEMYNIKLTQFSKIQQKEGQEAQSLLQSVTEVFQKQLYASHGSIALKYLTEKRKITPDSIKNFKIGYCPQESDFLLSYFPDKIEDLIKLGLISKKEGGGYYSNFAGRVIFPILDRSGNSIAFGGRIFEKRQEDAKLAKYINSKESDIFKKNRVIYGLDKAKKSKSIIIVEGYLDVIKMHQHGFTQTVAQMGTAFAEEQINTLFTNHNEFIFCYDSDEAGKKAELRAIDLCLKYLNPEKNLFFLNLPTKDADEFLDTYGEQKMIELITNKTPLYEKVFNIYSKGIDFKNPSQSSICEDNLIKFTANIPNAIIKKNYQLYFKNRIFEAKFTKKQVKTVNYIESSPMPITDCMLISLFLKFPDFFKSDYYLEHFVPTKTTKAYKIINGEEADLTFCESIKLKYPISASDPIEFYKNIYNDFIVQNLLQDRKKALENNDFKAVKYINEELERLKMRA